LDQDTGLAVGYGEVAALAACLPARPTYALPIIEPVGHRRRNHSLCPIDLVLNVALFERAPRDVARAGVCAERVALSPAVPPSHVALGLPKQLPPAIVPIWMVS
jgi:hypothetical protein